MSNDPIGNEPRSYEVDHKLVNDMANHMFEKMRKNKNKAHWSTVPQGWLIKRLREELEELEYALFTYESTPEDIAKECADVANFAAMISDNATFAGKKNQ